jgi:hypothetical protein
VFMVDEVAVGNVHSKAGYCFGFPLLITIPLLLHIHTVYSRIYSAPFLQFQRAKKSDAD